MGQFDKLCELKPFNFSSKLHDLKPAVTFEMSGTHNGAPSVLIRPNFVLVRRVEVRLYATPTSLDHLTASISSTSCQPSAVSRFRAGYPLQPLSRSNLSRMTGRE